MKQWSEGIYRIGRITQWIIGSIKIMGILCIAYRARVGIEMSTVLEIEVPNQPVSLGRREQRVVVLLGGGGQEKNF